MQKHLSDRSDAVLGCACAFVQLTILAYINDYFNTPQEAKSDLKGLHVIPKGLFFHKNTVPFPFLWAIAPGEDGFPLASGGRG